MRKLPLLAVLFVASPLAAAETSTFGSVPAYNDCIATLATKPEDALRQAFDWRDRGGGLPAQHCAAMALLELDQPTEAAIMLEAMVRENETRPAIERATLLHQAGTAWLQARQAGAAEAAFSNAVRLSAQDPLLWKDRARARALRQDWRGADSDLTVALSFDKMDPEIYVLRSSARRALGRNAEADADVHAALAMDPENVDALVERGAIKAAAGDRNGARADWARVLLKAPQSAAADSARSRIEALDFNPDR
jgi:tetratricopeptide (TPR) repeat protein